MLYRAGEACGAWLWHWDALCLLKRKPPACPLLQAAGIRFIAVRNEQAAGRPRLVPLKQNPPACLFLQAAGIRFIAFRNEQAAGYAAAASGFLTGVPGVLLTVSGPGVVHGLAGLSHAQVNTWPMLMISGSAEQARPRRIRTATVSYGLPYVLFRKGHAHGRCPHHVPIYTPLLDPGKTVLMVVVWAWSSTWGVRHPSSPCQAGLNLHKYMGELTLVLGAQSELGKGSFQELDQVAAVRPFTKYAGRAACARDIAPVLTAAVKATGTGRPGATYVDLPSDVLMAAVPPGELPAARAEGPDPGDAPAGFPAVAERQHADAAAVAAAAALLRGAQRSASPYAALHDQHGSAVITLMCGQLYVLTMPGVLQTRSMLCNCERTLPDAHMSSVQAAAGGGQGRGIVICRGLHSLTMGGDYTRAAACFAIAINTAKHADMAGVQAAAGGRQRRSIAVCGGLQSLRRGGALHTRSVFCAFLP